MENLLGEQELQTADSRPLVLVIFWKTFTIARPNVLASTGFKSGQFSFACQPFAKYMYISYNSEKGA